MPDSFRARLRISLDIVFPVKLPPAVLLVFLLGDLGLTEHPTVIRATQTNRAIVTENRDLMGIFLWPGLINSEHAPIFSELFIGLIGTILERFFAWTGTSMKNPFKRKTRLKQVAKDSWPRLQRDFTSNLTEIKVFNKRGGEVARFFRGL
jgi:hypothetical protein